MAARLRLPAADVNVISGDPALPGRSITLIQSTISTTVEDDFSPRGQITSRGAVRIVADARLDNRAALCAAVGLPSLDSISDETLILCAYERWGRECASRLRGDFAFIIFDEARQLVLACRDPFGVRILAYARDGDRIVIASTIGAVEGALRRRPKPNLEYLENFIRGTDAWMPGPTAYDTIYWIPPAHQIEICRDSFTVARYDKIRPVPPRNRKPAEVFAEFRSLLTAAVETRLRGKSPLGFMVSGGFDSSSILRLANTAVDEGRCPAKLRSYSAVYDRFTEADDRPYLTSVLTSCQHVAATLLPWDDERWTVAGLDGRDGAPFEEPPRGPRSFGPVIARRAAADGCQIMVGGLWADQLLFGSPYSFGRLLWDLPLGPMVREARAFLAESAAVALTRSLVPGGVLRVRRLAAALGLADPPVRAAGSLLLRRVVHGRHAGIMVDAARTSKWVGVENRLPFLDRDLQEFVMSLPSEYFFEGGRSKRLLREGLRDTLPPEFQQRRHVAHAGRFVFEAMKAERDEIARHLRSPLVVQKGLVPAAVVRRLVETLWSDSPTGPIPAIQRLLTAEIWLRDQE